MTPKHCYDCDHVRSQRYDDGTTIYLCALTPGLVKGCVSAFDNDEPMACEKHTKATERDDLEAEKQARDLQKKISRPM